jgi:putative GTP pyrophosphokinase
VNEADLCAAFEAQKPLLIAWGEMVKETICAGVSQAIEPTRKLEYFLKVPPLVRVKSTDSFLGKALRRGKEYKRPLDEITDRVGVRFVVLLRSELDVVQKVVEETTLWEAELARDFEAEQTERPHHFDYQSVHYIVRPIKPTPAGTVMVPAGLPCEVQVRTLLQHAYAELARETTYKPSIMTDRTVIRHIAKGSALVETTDEIFVKVAEQIEQASSEIRRIHELSVNAYATLTGLSGDDDMRLSFAMMDRYQSVLPSITQGALSSFLEENDFLANKIRERAPLSHFYRHAIVVVIYFLAETETDLLAREWRFDLKHLEMVYADLGISSEGRVW